jgi:hypothetical protein
VNVLSGEVHEVTDRHIRVQFYSPLSHQVVSNYVEWFVVVRTTDWISFEILTTRFGTETEIIYIFLPVNCIV